MTADNERNRIRAFIADELSAKNFQPRSDAWLSGFNPGFSRRLGAAGFIGMTWPRQYGGHERSQLDRYAVVEELLAAGAPVAAHWIGDRQTGPLLLRYGTEEQRQRFLPAVAAGECTFAIGMSEPDSGSDLASIRTSATPVEGGWKLNGTKIWTSGAHEGHFMITLVRTSPAGENRHAGMSQLLVDLHGPGIEVRPIKLLTGEAHFNEVVFTDAFVGRDMLVGTEGEGWRQVTSELAFERSGPERFLSTFQLLRATVGAVPAASHATAARAIGVLVSRLTALRQMSMEVAARLERGETPAVAAAMVKDLGTRFEREVIDAARSLVDPATAPEEWRRLYREAVLHAPGFTLRGGTNEILRGIVAKDLAARGLTRDPGGEDIALLTETARRVFAGGVASGRDVESEMAAAGLDDLSSLGLLEVAAVVHAAAYEGGPEDFAARALRDRVPGWEALANAMRMAATLERVSAMTVAYATERVQFGKPLSAFQAVQQELAEMAAESSLAAAAVAAAVLQPDARRIAVARVEVSRATRTVTAIAHQVHGAIGTTEEHDLHRFTTRLWRWRDEDGTEAPFEAGLGNAALAAGPDGLWPGITD